MKKLIFLTLVAVTIFAETTVVAQSTVQKYTCVMHPEIMMDQPGKCPKCGMALVAVDAEKKRPTPNGDMNHATHDEHDIVAHETRRLQSEHRDEMHEMRPQHMAMQSSVNIAEPMSRESSGTSWVPDSTPMYGRMLMFGDDMLMLHGGIFPRYTNANTRRGDDRIDAPNWFMAMYSHPIGDNAQLGFRGMMSLDLLTEGGRGYPLLFQTGETWNGKALHDRQHPHDLFDEVSVSYSQEFGHDLSAYLYVGYPGAGAGAADVYASAFRNG